MHDFYPLPGEYMVCSDSVLTLDECQETQVSMPQLIPLIKTSAEIL